LLKPLIRMSADAICWICY